MARKKLQGIPNTREARWVGDLVIKNVIYNKDVDTEEPVDLRCVWRIPFQTSQPHGGR